MALHGAGQPVEVVILAVADDGTNLALGVLFNRLQSVAHVVQFILVGAKQTGTVGNCCAGYSATT